MWLILIAISGLVLFNYSIYQSSKIANKLIDAGMALVGTGTLCFYGIAFEFLVSLTDRKG
jgi:hypothetical protein